MPNAAFGVYMSFKIWFKAWMRSFYKLIMSGMSSRKRDSERERERARRREKKYSSKVKYSESRRLRRRRKPNETVREKSFGAAVGFAFASILGILLLPFGLVGWGARSVVKTSESKRKSSSTGVTSSRISSGREGAHAATRAKKCTDERCETEGKPRGAEAQAAFGAQKPEGVPDIGDHNSDGAHEDVKNVPPRAENEPKSWPKCERDRYIRRRMLINGAENGEREVLSRLDVGTYLDVFRDLQDPHDKNAVALLYEGTPVGYIAKNEALALITCLELGQIIYAVITDIIHENGKASYELELWITN